MIGLCICYYNNNYGSMLQAYATTQELEQRGLSYEIIAYKKEINFIYLIQNIGRLFNKYWLQEKSLVLQKKISRKKYPAYDMNTQIRDKKFFEFRHKYFDGKVRVCKGYTELKSIADTYDIVIVGSDQMWSPSGLATNFYNLMFVPDNTRKVSYASSFGVEKIPAYQKKRTAVFLKRIEYLSVREKSAVNIIAELTNRNAELVVDPTMLLSRKEWESFSAKDRVVDEPYIFSYFLGSNSEHREKTVALSKIKKLKIVTLRHLDEYFASDEKFGDIALYDIGPKEFLNLIKNAEYICTDSFHGTVFSILFQKQFLTFFRYNANASISKNSRITSLLSSLGLTHRSYNNANSIVQQIDDEIDYGKVEANLSRMVKNSKLFLDEALRL